MLTRRLAAGPLPAVFLRRLATTAPEVSSKAAEKPSQKQPVAPLVATDAVAGSVPSSKDISRLLAITSSSSPITLRDRHEAWAIYKNLSRAQRSTLSTQQLKIVLRTLVPRYDDAWTSVRAGPKRQLPAVNHKVGKQWEFRLRAVMSDIVSREAADLSDWLFVFACLSKTGYVSAMESIVRELPMKFKTSQRVSEFRLGAIVMLARNLRAGAKRPAVGDIDLAHTAFWEIFSGIQEQKPALSAFTLRLLLSATSEVSALVAPLGQEDLSKRFDNFFQFILHKGYGVDLDNLAASLEQRDKDETSLYPRLSGKGIHAVLSYMAAKGATPYRLLAVSELLTQRRVGTESERLYQDEDGDDLGPVLSEVTAEDQSTQRNWMGYEKGTTKFFTSTPATEAQTPEQGAEVFQGRRFLDAFLPAPSLSSVDNTVASPPVQNMPDARTTLVLLNACRAAEKPRLLYNVLGTALYGTQCELASWFAQYHECPPDMRSRVRKPSRLLPEWFRVGLAHDNGNYHRFAASKAQALESALTSVEHQIDMIIAAETKHAPLSSVAQDGRVSLPLPGFAEDPRRRRILHSTGIFIASEYLQTLYEDKEKLSALLARATELVAKRKENLAASRARRRERQNAAMLAAEVANQRAVAEHEDAERDLSTASSIHMSLAK